MKLKNLILLLMTISILLLTTSCYNNNEPKKETEFIMGTFVSITLFDNTSDELFNEIFQTVRKIENKMTVKQINSEIVEINKNAGLQEVSVSKDTFFVFETALKYAKLSKGNFDISIGPIEELWAIGSENEHVPSQDEITTALQLVDYKKILLNEENTTVFLTEKNMKIDLGSIVKGFATDEIVTILKTHKIKSAIIDLGGNIYAYGVKPDNTMWNVGIQDPFASRNDYLGIIEVQNKSVVSSGTYERFFTEGGKIYHHILSPYNGYPIDNELIAINIVASESIDCDALSTAIFSLGLEKGLKTVNELENIEAIFITNNKEIFLSNNISDNFQLTNDEFIIKK